MIGLFDRLARPLLGLLDAEDAHRLAVQGLRLVPRGPAPADDPRLSVRVFGLNFPNPVGMAAGFDKHGEVPDALLRLGFGFVEVGTVTPLPQPGNPRPRLFRLPADEGVINRLGFNSEGARAVLARLAARAGAGGLVGVNVGANKDSRDRIADYVSLIETFAPVASYFTVNISSPNTPGLRDLQQGQLFDELLARVVDARARASRRAGLTPLLIKIAPDLSLSELDDVVRRGAPPARRRHDRRQHHGGPAAGAAGRQDRQGIRRALRPAAVRAVDPHAGGDLCARRGRLSAGRDRRHRFRPHRLGQDQGRRLPGAALFEPGVPRARAGGRDQV